MNTKKELHIETLFVNWARNGLLLEPLNAFSQVVKNEEYQYIMNNLFKFAA